MQQWGVPAISPDRDMAAFLAHPATQNYTSRLPKIPGLIARPFTLDRSRLDGPDKLT